MWDDAPAAGMRHTARLTLQLMRASGLPRVQALIALALVGAACEVMAVAALLPLMMGLNGLGEGHAPRGLLAAHAAVPGGALGAMGLIAFMVLAILAGLLIRRHLILSAYAHAGALASRLFGVLLHQDPLKISEAGAATLNDAVINDCERVCSHVFLGLLVVVGNVCTALGIAAVLAWAQPQLALGLSLVMGLIYLGWLSRVRRQAIHLGHEVSQLTHQALQTGQASFQGIAAVQSLQAQDGLARLQSETLIRRAQLTGRAEWLGEMPRKVVELLALTATLAILLWTVLARASLREVLPLLALYLFAAFRMLPVVQQTFQQVIRLRFNATTVRRLARMLNDDLSLAAGGTAAVPGLTASDASLVMSDVWFAHAFGQTAPPHDAFVLRGASFVAHRSSFVAIVGASGVGKSTALMVLAGLASPARGQVNMSRAVGDVQPCRRVLVPQDVAVWEASLLANVALGDAAPDLARAQAAARVAVLDEVVARLPQGWHTTLAGDVGRLSGGERQRLALARAIYVNPDILLLDEVTSALDPETEHEVLSRLRAWQAGRTVIMVTHRAAVTQQADEVYSLTAGRLQPVAKPDAALMAAQP
jgi:ABC-type bacteriocin/lantibiotic exporter with double-glycine peptidase domain